MIYLDDLDTIFIPRKIKPQDTFDTGEERRRIGFGISIQNDVNDFTLLENICDST